ncbi:MAG: cation:dicarboxylase symporter family transporter [Halioglobus sp.]
MIQSAEKKSLGLSDKIMAGLLVGIATGLFFGELTAPLSYLGDAFVGLLQMTVLPYIMLALIGGIGGLTAVQSRLLIARVIPIILLLWVAGYFAVFLFGLSLPEHTGASFFSSSLVEKPKPFDFYALFIPANPFSAMAQNKVPAVVLFSALCGVGIMGLAGKEGVIKGLGIAQNVLGRVTGFIVQLSPYGVFCIAASAAGTMHLEDLARIQGYMVLMTATTLAICFLLMPALITTLTPFTSRDVSPFLRAVFILAFATGKTLVVLPMLMEGMREIFEKKGLANKDTEATAEVLAPLAYAFPHLGRILATAFIPFGAWYIGQPLTLEQYPLLLSASSFVHFSTAPVSVPFLLDLMQLPSDLFQLFLVTGVYMSRLTDAAGASYILVVTLLGTCAATGTLQLPWKRIGGLLGVGAIVCGVLVLGGRFYMDATASTEYNKDKIVAAMHLPRLTAQATMVEPGPNPTPLQPGQTRLERILDRGIIRIGFIPDNLPFSHINSAGEPAGFDIEMMSELALDLDVAAELVPIPERHRVEEELRLDYYDLAVGGFVDTVAMSQRTPFTDPYMYLHMALVIPDFRDRDFSSMDKINRLTKPRIAVVGGDGLSRETAAYFPGADIVTIDAPATFFQQALEEPLADALLMSAEAGSAWTMLFPHYQVATPLPDPVRLPIVVLYSGVADPVMDEFLDNWIMLKRNSGKLKRIEDYWIFGRGTETKSPRWSVVRDVLGWVD